MSRARTPVDPGPAGQVSSDPPTTEDRLTGLPDRAAFRAAVSAALGRARAGPGELAVLLIALDRYRWARGSLGPAAGDALLGAVAGRLAATLRTADVLARLSDTGFAVLLQGITSAGDATAAAQRLIAAFERPFTAGTRQVLMRVSIGVAMGGYAMDDADELLRNAEVATARAQADGGGRWASFDPSMHEAALARFELEQSLAGALEGGQLTLDYQPMVRLAGPYAGSGHIRHAEALIRWRHPDRGLVGPDEFVPLAEESGLIVPIGTWVLREATRQARVWQLMSDDTSRFTVSVNLSPRQLHHPGLVGDVALALRASGLAAGTLVLEITEGAVLRDPEAAIPVLAALRQLGVRIALDDFGTGQSSLSHLTRLPLDSLKVDRSFVAGLGSDGPETAVVRALIQLGKVLGLEVIAEGVETREQLASLRSMGCDLAQGFFFGKPLGPDGITALLRAERRKSGSWAAGR